MKRFIGRCVLKYKHANILYKILKRRSTNRSILESERRKDINIFDYLSLSRPIEKTHQYYYGENNLYGNGKILDFLDNINEEDAGIEHGFIFGSLVQNNNIVSNIKYIVTFSDYRKNYLLQKTDKDIICVGPYIHYFSSILNKKELSILKDKLGKTLLVFPSHSLKDINVEFNKREFIDTIKEQAIGYQSVLICLYWADILKGEDKYYIHDKFKIVTAGHLYDTYFLNRLRTFIELSDFVISNSVGTHVGYSIYLNKPLYLFKQNTKISLANLSSTELSQRNNDDNFSMDFLREKLFDLFNNKFNENITKEQFDFVSDLFGFEYIR